ncbi:ABC transporter ATP-binding protein [soil metagenome]
MSDLAIKVENLSKIYRLGIVGTGSLKHDLRRWWTTNILKEEDPFLKIGSANLRNQKADSEYVWALKNINFELEKGQALGIVGSNGSGKSTLLKILSRVTAPTTGTVKVKGRVASLLEVGTGFHGELSGRHNIFLNGSIMGMSKGEIKSKFEEIVKFSGVERYIDTPVKRYSSGMYVRLAFAVAAHLEPDILIVDEVLAVGDAEFQKKCLGKMQDASEKEGRTVLFVSHNMQAIKDLCTKAILLKNGNIIDGGHPENVINKYLSNIANNQLEKSWRSLKEAPGNEKVKVKSVKLTPQLKNQTDPIDIRTPLSFKMEFWNLMPNSMISVTMMLYSISGICVFTLATTPVLLGEGLAMAECAIPGNLLNNGKYSVTVNIDKNASQNLYTLDGAIVFEVENHKLNVEWYGVWPGVVRPNIPFSLEMMQPHLVK